ncbi:sporulation protein [Hazenella sp. IB182357]|uniref:Sporulation protein n=1 Tax=Polycladospora coralii TaxID=2771432 RepID=A0A926NFE3_9BACL|nr:sporulation protein [Polycladospora coralii]MBD1372534.1 sporulation protein [Polycladospora coralii]MBS7531343.1 sporulation protein [Polycladospora coralii]
MFKSLLASLGVGSAKIDLVLSHNRIQMGEQVTGKIVLTGGEVEQSIDELSVTFSLASSYRTDDLDIPVHEKIAHIPIFSKPFQIDAGEVKEFPFSFVCPNLIPVSSLNTRYYFKTDLEINKGIDAEDRDFVDIIPADGLLKNFLDGFKQLGFVHHIEGYNGERLGGWQMIHFRPTSWLSGEFDEIFFMYQPKHTLNGVSGRFELDKKTSGIFGKIADELDLDEKKGRFYFDQADLATVDQAASTIRSFIEKHAEGLYGR